jgi:hypothetical protein
MRGGIWDKTKQKRRSFDRRFCQQNKGKGDKNETPTMPSICPRTQYHRCKNNGSTQKLKLCAGLAMGAIAPIAFYQCL